MKPVHYVPKMPSRTEEAVSPVIATILMVAITVVLAVAVYVGVSHYGIASSTPIAGSLAEMTTTTDSVTLQLTYSTPASMSNLGNIHLSLLNPSGATVASWTSPITVGSAYASNVTGLTITITNPDGSTTALESGATMVLTFPSGTNFYGDVFDISYTGNTGTISTTLS